MGVWVNTVFLTKPIRPQTAEEDFSNLAMFLNRLRRHPKAKVALLTALRDLYDGLTDFDVRVESGTVQVFFTEGEFTIPATRLSDGTLRYLCLLAILCDPEPPPLIGIEEPELGLHPDILPKLADLLVAASERTQLLVTTHSDVLVDALTERPESIVVCEKHAGQTRMQRLDNERLAHWLATGWANCGHAANSVARDGERPSLRGRRRRQPRTTCALPRGFSQTAGKSWLCRADAAHCGRWRPERDL